MLSEFITTKMFNNLVIGESPAFSDNAYSLLTYTKGCYVIKTLRESGLEGLGDTVMNRLARSSFSGLR